MNNKSQTILSFILSKSLFFSFVIPFIFKLNNQSYFISLILGYLLGITTIYYIIKYNLYSKIITTILSLISFIFLLINYLNQVNYFYLNNTPLIIIALSLFLISIYASKDLKIVLRISDILIIIDIFLILIGLIFNYNNYEFKNIFPLLNFNYLNIIYSTLIVYLSSVIPLIILINLEKTKYINIFKGYTYSFICILLISFSTLLSLGNTLTTHFIYPTYYSYKKISIINVISKVENIISLYSLIDLVILSIIILLYLNKTISKKISVTLISIITILVVILM